MIAYWALGRRYKDEKCFAFFAPKALWILAGGERSVTTGTVLNMFPSPERAVDHFSSFALSGLEEIPSVVPVVPPSSTTG